MRRKIRPFLLLSLLICFGHLNAQDCLERIYNASNLLDAGNTDGCIGLVRSCSAKENEDRVRWQACRLMAISYVLKGNMDSAMHATENMLDINPTYKPNLLKDPQEFITLLKKVVVIPRFTLGLSFSIGTNTTFPKITQGYVVSDYLKTYYARNSFQFGTNIGLHLNRRIAIDLGLYASSKQFRIDYSFTNWNLGMNQRLTYLDIPLNIRYDLFPSRKIGLIPQAGIFVGYLLYCENDFRSEQVSPNVTFELSKLNSIQRYNRVNAGACAGLGVTWKAPQGQVMLIANYLRSFTNIINTSKRYNYNELIYTYYYVDDDIRLDNLVVSIGYSRYLNYKVFRSNSGK
jgi:hypothetical protein